MGYLDGFGVTLRKMLGVHTDTGRRVTTEYPEEVRPKPERFHGRHVLNRYEDGMEKCIGCELCAGVCPARCIYVRGRDNDPEHPTSPGERYGYVYEINYLRCIHCDLCVEACPTEAITETKMFEFAFTDRKDAIYTKDELLVDDDGRPRKLPWEHWEGGFDAAAETSGWMRATSPGGDADFVGLVAWAGELGYGVRPAEHAADVQEPVLPAAASGDHDGHGGADGHGSGGTAVAVDRDGGDGHGEPTEATTTATARGQFDLHGDAPAAPRARTEGAAPTTATTTSSTGTEPDAAPLEAPEPPAPAAPEPSTTPEPSGAPADDVDEPEDAPADRGDAASGSTAPRRGVFDAGPDEGDGDGGEGRGRFRRRGDRR